MIQPSLIIYSSMSFLYWGLQTWAQYLEPLKGRAGGKHFPHLAGHPFIDAARETVGFVDCKHTLLACVKLFIHQNPQVLLCSAVVNARVSFRLLNQRESRMRPLLLSVFMWVMCPSVLICMAIDFMYGYVQFVWEYVFVWCKHICLLRILGLAAGLHWECGAVAASPLSNNKI